MVVNLPLTGKALPDRPAVSRFPELRHGPGKICGNFYFFLSDLQSSVLVFIYCEVIKKIMLVLFAHNWNVGILEQWNIVFWENGKLGYCKITLDGN